MSCHMRSRMISSDGARSSRTNEGPARVKRTEPTFAQLSPGARSSHRNASSRPGRSRATMISAIGGSEFVGEAFGEAGIGEPRRPDGDELGAGAQVLPGIGRGTDPPDPDDERIRELRPGLSHREDTNG